MKPDIETIVQDICAYSPELAADTHGVRQLVATMLAARPDVVIDEHFKTQLRARLVLQNSNVKSTRWPWLFVYTIPVGVTAVLLLLLRPEMSVAPQAALHMDEESVSEHATLKMESMPSSDTAMDSYATFASPQADQSAAVSAQDILTATVGDDKQTVLVSYLSLTSPGFVVVTDSDGLYFGVSDYIPTGESTDLTIPLAQPLTVGVIYQATLYYDNGNGIYDNSEDMIVLDFDGTPLTVLLVAQ